MIYETSFRDMRHGKGRDRVVESDASIVHFHNSGGRSIGDTFVMVKVTGLSRDSVIDIAQASVKAVSAAKGE